MRRCANHGENSLLKDPLCLWCGTPVKKQCRLLAKKERFCGTSCETSYSIRRVSERLFRRVKAKNFSPSLGRALEKSFFFLVKERSIRPPASWRYGLFS